MKTSASFRKGTMATLVTVALGAGTLMWGTEAQARGRRKVAKVTKGSYGPQKGKKKPLFARRTLRVELGYRDGKIATRHLHVKLHSKRIRIPQFEGRFEARLYKKRKIFCRVRFDFPLLGIAETFTPTGKKLWKRIKKGVKTRTTIELPWDVKAQRIVIWDRLEKRSAPVALSLMKRHGMSVAHKKVDAKRKKERSGANGSKKSSEKSHGGKEAGGK